MLMKLKTCLSNVAVVLSILGIITFSLFIFEEAIQMATFGTWPAQYTKDWVLFKRWKSNRNPSLTDQMAGDFLPFLQTTGGQVIKNHYDLITTAPPSANRCPNRYCVHDLAKAISRKTCIPFVPAFSQKTDKTHHGRHSSPVK